MGQKVHPVGMRLGIFRNWSSVWYANSKHYPNILKSDIEIRKLINKKLHKAQISKILIERPSQNAKITIFTAKPGIVIGKKGEDVDKLRNILIKKIGIPIQLNIEEIKHPDLDAHIVVYNICQQLEKRVMFRRVMKKSIQSSMRLGAKGIKILISGRLGGAEIARKEWLKEGSIPLHTFRANIDYAMSTALTTYGLLGVKVWIFKGETVKRKIKV